MRVYREMSCKLNKSRIKSFSLSPHKSSHVIIIIFNIYIAQINIQEDMINCALRIKIESKITMLP